MPAMDTTPNAAGGRELLERLLDATERHDIEALRPLMHARIVSTWPQSGERFSGPLGDEHVTQDVAVLGRQRDALEIPFERPAALRAVGMQCRPGGAHSMQPGVGVSGLRHVRPPPLISSGLPGRSSRSRRRSPAARRHA